MAYPEDLWPKFWDCEIIHVKLSKRQSRAKREGVRGLCSPENFDASGFLREDFLYFEDTILVFSKSGVKALTSPGSFELFGQIARIKIYCLRVWLQYKHLKIIWINDIVCLYFLVVLGTSDWLSQRNRTSNS